MSILKKLQNPSVSLMINLLYAVGHCALGLQMHSWWFITVGIYYAVLSAARFCVVSTAKKADRKPNAGSFARRITGILLIALSFCLIGINILSAVKERGTHFHEIIMIAIALYAFSKITLATIGMIKARQSVSQFTGILRNISFADSVVSIYSLQRSMLVSFPGLNPSDIQLFNILTGTAVWIIVLCSGINLLGGKYIVMAKSRIAKINQKISESVTKGYKKIETGVVEGYRKIEQGVVRSYTRLEDKFVDAFLAHEDETVEEAKERLKKETK